MLQLSKINNLVILVTVFCQPEEVKSGSVFHKIRPAWSPESIFFFEKGSWNFDSSISCYFKRKPYLKSQAGCGWVLTVDDFPKQLSHTRTGDWPQPRSGTGFLLVEHASQTPPPQARQWCLVSPSAKRRRHDWHAWKWVQKMDDFREFCWQNGTDAL